MTFPPLDGEPHDPHPAAPPYQGQPYQGPPAWGPPPVYGQQFGQQFGPQQPPPQPYPPYGGQPYPGQPYQPYAYGPPQPAPAPHKLTPPAIGWVLLALAGLVAIGAVLPWAKVFGFTVTGTDGDGVLTLACALVVGAAGLVIVLGQGRLWASIAAAVFGGLVALIGFIDLADVRGVVADHAVIDGAVSVGSGLWLTLVAGLAVLVAAVAGMVRRR